MCRIEIQNDAGDYEVRKQLSEYDPAKIWQICGLGDLWLLSVAVSVACILLVPLSFGF